MIGPSPRPQRVGGGSYARPRNAVETDASSHELGGEMRPSPYLIALMLGALSASATAAEKLPFNPWYTLIEVPAREPEGKVQIDVSPPRGYEVFWKARRLAFGKTDWIDGRRCPKLAMRMETLKGLPQLVARLPEDEFNPVNDGTIYTVKSLGYFVAGNGAGEITLSGNIDTPLATWVEGTKKLLSDCWQNDYPE